MAGIPQIETYDIPTSLQLPTNVAGWKIDPNRAVLLVHDMQRFFIRKFPSIEPKQTLLKNTRLLRECALENNIQTAYTCQTGDMSEKQRGLLKSFWGKGMKSSPSDREVVDGLTPTADDWLFAKWRYSAFHNSDLLSRLQRSGRDQLIICGVYAHIGILITAVEAFSNDIETFLVADAVADFSKSYHLMAMEYAARCCAVVITTQKVLQSCARF